MARANIENALEREVNKLKKRESEKRTELQEIQEELKRHQKALDSLKKRTSVNKNKARTMVK